MARGLDLLSGGAAKALQQAYSNRMNIAYQKLGILQQERQRAFQNRLAKERMVFDAEQDAKKMESDRTKYEYQEEQAMDRTKYIQDEMTKRKKIPTESKVYHYNSGTKPGRDYTVTEVSKIADDYYQEELDSINAELKTMLSNKYTFLIDQDKVNELTKRRDALTKAKAEFLKENVGDRMKFIVPEKEDNVPFFLRRPEEQSKNNWSPYEAK